MPGDDHNAKFFPNKVIDSFPKEARNNVDLRKIINEESIKKGPGYILGNLRVGVLNKKLKRGILKLRGSELTPTNNELKDIIKVITRSLENRGLLLKRNSIKLLVKKEDFSIFLNH